MTKINQYELLVRVRIDAPSIEVAYDRMAELSNDFIVGPDVEDYSIIGSYDDDEVIG